MAEAEEPLEIPPTPAQTALLNDLILRDLSRLLPYPDLKSAQKVCLAWNRNMRHHFFKSSFIKLNRMRRMRRFTREINGDQNLPQIQLCIPRSSQTDEIKPSDFNDFFNKFSGQILKLEFLIVLNSARNENLLEWLELLEDLDKLEKLWLDVDYYELLPINHINLDSIPMLKSLTEFNIGVSCKLEGINPSEGWAEENQMYRKLSQIIIKMGPEITSLGIDDIDFLDYNCNEIFQTQFFTLLNNPDFGLSKLQDVRIRGLPESPLALRQIPNLLKSLIIIWDNNTNSPPTPEDFTDLTELLGKHCKTLEEFTLSFKPEVEELDNTTVAIKIGLKFPKVMPKLEKLHLQLIPPEELEDFRIDSQMEIVDYSKTFPKIQDMTLDHGDLFRGLLNDIFLPRKMPKCHTLKRLWVKDPRRKLQQGFPEAIIESQESEVWGI